MTSSGRTGLVRWFVRILLGALALLAPPTHAQPSEYQVKAVFLFNFAQFVNWPPEAFADPVAPLVVGVLGDDPFGPLLEAAVQGEVANGRPFLVQRFRRVQDIGACHILYISRSEAGRTGGILADLRGRSILTVGETEDFVPAGGVVQFLKTNNRTRLRIDVGAAREAHLQLSSKLLRVAEIVGAEEG